MIKLRIDLKEGVIEVEGEDSFVKDVYSDFKAHLKPSSHSEAKPFSVFSKTPIQVKEKHAEAPSKKRVKKSTVGALPQQLPEIKAALTKDFTKFKKFYDERQPDSFAEKNVTFVYYLERELSVEKIGVDHIYTCYRVLGIRTPEHFRQSVVDTSSKKQWLDTDDMSDIKVNGKGQLVVEFDLKENQKKVKNV